MTPLPNLLGLVPAELANLIGGTGRAKAVWQQICKGQDPLSPGVLSPKAHSQLVAAVAGQQVNLKKCTRAPCGTTKLLIGLPDGRAIETVVIPKPDRTTVCVSAQVGCARRCTFCATATMGLVRSLAPWEIVAQTHLAVSIAAQDSMPPVRNVVFMGMGEPLDNLAAVTQSIAILTDPHGFAIAPRHVTLSTIGPSPKTIQQAGRLPVSLAWSLHTANNALHRQLVPTTRHSLPDLRQAFLETVQHRRAYLLVEIALIHQTNDSDAHATELADFLGVFGSQVRVNLLPLNPARQGLAPSPPERVAAFQQILRKHGCFCIVRQARGSETSAACGQLVVGDQRMPS